MIAKPRLLVLQSSKVNFDLPTYVESDAVREHFHVMKASKLKGDPDIVYSQAYMPFYDDIMGCDVPVVLHFGGSPWLEFTGERLERAIRMAEKAKVVVCNSRFLYGVFRKHMPDAKNLRTLPDGLWGLDHTPIGPMPPRFRPKEDYSVGNEFKVVMSINLVFNSVKRNKWAGVPMLLDAVKGMPAVKERRVRFLCACKGSERFPPLDDWKRDCSFSYVRQHHLKDDLDHWPEILRGADLFVHPSTFDCWPRAVADAALTAVPGFVFDATGNAEVSRAYPAVDPEDPDKIRGLFEKMLLDEGTRRAVGTMAHYDALRRTHEHREDYANLLLEVLKCG